MSTNEFNLYKDLPDTLPNDLLYELLNKAKLGHQPSRDIVIKHNIKLVIYEVNKKFNNIDYEKDDLVSIGIIGLIKSINTFDTSKNILFSTYASRCIDNEILMHVRKLSNIPPSVSMDSILYIDKENNELTIKDTIRDNTDMTEEYEHLELLQIINKIVNELPSPDKEIMKLSFGFYNDKVYTQRQISQIFSYSQPHISRIIKKNLDKIALLLAQEELIGSASNKQLKKKK